MNNYYDPNTRHTQTLTQSIKISLKFAGCKVKGQVGIIKHIVTYGITECWVNQVTKYAEVVVSLPSKFLISIYFYFHLSNNFEIDFWVVLLAPFPIDAAFIISNRLLGHKSSFKRSLSVSTTSEKKNSVRNDHKIPSRHDLFREF